MADSGTIKSVKVWECMALQMADGLRKVADGSLDHNRFSPGTLADARAFLESVREIISERIFGKMPAAPQGDRANFASAREALANMQVLQCLMPLRDDDLALLALAEFVKRLSQPSVFSCREKLKISALWAASFFEALAALPE